MKTQTQLKVYLSHQICGPDGDNATQKTIQSNLKKYSKIGEQLKAYFLDWEKMNDYPKVNLYVPADHDEFVQIAWHKKYLNREQILEVDCDIISTCDLVIIFNDSGMSGGMKVEYDYAVKNGKYVLMMQDLESFSIESLQFVIYLIATGEGIERDDCSE